VSITLISHSAQFRFHSVQTSSQIVIARIGLSIHHEPPTDDDFLNGPVTSSQA
jgi:hypothetical protein